MTAELKNAMEDLEDGVTKKVREEKEEMDIRKEKVRKESCWEVQPLTFF